jgi:hypothetical protein
MHSRGCLYRHMGSQLLSNIVNKFEKKKEEFVLSNLIAYDLSMLLACRFLLL